MKALKRLLITSGFGDTYCRRIDEEIVPFDPRSVAAGCFTNMLGPERFIRDCGGKHVVRALSGSRELH